MQTIQYITVSEGETGECIFNQTRNSGLLYNRVLYFLNLMWLFAELFWHSLDNWTTDKAGIWDGISPTAEVCIEINPNMNIKYYIFFKLLYLIIR
jgi:hypothetical protein